MRLASRITQLEKRLKLSQSQSSQNKLIVPERWSDFAYSTKIRSGTEFKPFDPYHYQRQISDLIDHNSYVLIVKGRQLGISETILSKFLHWAIKNPAFCGLVVSKTLADAFALSKRLRSMAESIGVKLDTESLSEVSIAGGGKIVFRAPGEGCGRGLESVSAVLLDEFAFVPNDKQELTFGSALPSTEMLQGAERVIVVSTPRGRSGYYYELLIQDNGSVDAMRLIQQVRAGEAASFTHFRDESGWIKAIIHWRAHPIYGSNPNYLADVQRRKKLSRRQVEQEYDLSFDVADNGFFDWDAIIACADGQFEPPRKGVRYFCALDSASSGDDYLVFIVAGEIDGRLKIVALYRAKKRNMDRHVLKIGQLIEQYSPTIGVIETNSIGQLYLERLTRDFPTVQWEGHHTSQQSKLLLFERIAAYQEQRKISYPSGIIAEELEAIEQDGNRLEASKGSHDDTVMALALAIEAYETKPKRNRVDLSQIRRIE